MTKRRQCKRNTKGKSKSNQQVKGKTTKVYQSSRRYLCSEEEGSQVLFPEKPFEHLQLSLTPPLSEPGKSLYQPAVGNKISFTF